MRTFIFASLLIACILANADNIVTSNSGDEKFPILLFGPTTKIIREIQPITALPETLLGNPLPAEELINTGSSRAFVLLCNGQILELFENSLVYLNFSRTELNIKSGIGTLYIKNPPNTLCTNLKADSATVRYASGDSIFVIIGKDSLWLKRGEYFSYGKKSLPGGDWHSKPAKDADYLFELLDDGKLPAKSFDFDFPTAQPRAFRQTSRGYAGVATYDDEQYYYGGILYKAEFWKIKFIYDFWIAFSHRWKFYGDAWNEWGDILNHIHHIQIFEPQDPFFLRAGLIENLTFGRGLLVANYDNAVALPFEKHNGLDLRLSYKKIHAIAFINNIGAPRIFGANVEWERNSRTTFRFFYAGDFDQYSNIKDGDEDSYPDKIDPEPDKFNQRTDSVIVANSPQRLDEVDSRNLHGIGAGLQYRVFQIKDFSNSIAGETAILSSAGMGVSFPNLLLSYKWATFGIGFDFQTPRFSSGIFDRAYESNKAHFIKNEDDKLVLVSRGWEVSETEEWLYGWNYSLSFDAQQYARFRLAFRDVYRGDNRNENFSLSLQSEYPFTKYVSKASFFIEQKNVSRLFVQRTDGENWGFEFELKPHETIRARLRYRESYMDDNADGAISGSAETQRSIAANLIINGNYWWKKFVDWVKNRKKAKEEIETIPSDDDMFR